MKKEIKKKKENISYHGEACVVDTPLSTSFTFLSFLAMTNLGTLQQLPMNCQTIKHEETNETHKVSGTSLREAAMDTLENSFQYSYLALTFHHLETNEEQFPQENCLQSQHYVSYENKSKKKPSIAS